MNATLKRSLLIATVTWMGVWAYVGWRGYQQSRDAHALIDMLPAGANVPEAVLTALDAGQSWIRNAVICGAALPVFLLLLVWIVKPAVEEPSRPRR